METRRTFFGMLVALFTGIGCKERIAPESQTQLQPEPQTQTQHWIVITFPDNTYYSTVANVTIIDDVYHIDIPSSRSCVLINNDKAQL